MNLEQMSTFVRSQADTDEDDAPDVDLSVYARAAYRDIQSRVFPWPSKKVEYTFETVAGTSGYSFSAFSGGPDMEFVLRVADDDELLIYVSPEQFAELSTSSSGSATVYSVIGSQIVLWPTPNAAVTLTVSGYRDFAEWPAGSDEPDLPRGFDEAICWYMLSLFYKKQEDLELAENYMRDFEIAVNRQIEKALRSSSVSAGPMIFGGDPRLHSPVSYEDWVKRNVEGS